jgi:hypothetical protein
MQKAGFSKEIKTALLGGSLKIRKEKVMRILAILFFGYFLGLILENEVTAQETPIDCDTCIGWVSNSVKFLHSRQSMEMSCRLSEELCIEKIKLARESNSLSKKGVELLRTEKSCKGRKDLENILIGFQKDIKRNEKLVSEYEKKYKR